METTHAAAGDTGRPLSFFRSRLASFLAIAPLGVWTVIHVWNNLSAWNGPDAWEQSVTGYSSGLALGITSFIVLIPLVMHTIWGFARLRTSRPNNAKYGYFANLKYLLQRLSALGVLGFIIAHLWLAFIQPRFVERHAETFADIAAHMRHHPPTLLVYLLGTLAVSYHLGNGLFGFAWSFGLATSRKSLAGFEKAGIALFIILLAMSWGAVFGLYWMGAGFAPPVD
jgi:succinate dehydrogenase / fumarate reductase cytochrome b subunit